MNYQIYKFDFLTAVHLGEGMLDSSGCSFSSDRLFSALCQEAVKDSNEKLEQLVSMVREDRIFFSDGLPYIQDEYYLPKPVIYIGKGNDDGNSVVKKAYKNLKYIAVSQLKNYLHGDLDLTKTRDIKKLGHTEMKVSANIKSGEDTIQYRNGEENSSEALPYRIGIYRFNNGSGLYIVVGYESDEDLSFIEDLLMSLSYSGIGGRRSAGLGRFEMKFGKPSEILFNALENNNSKFQMLISQALPLEDELADAMDSATYSLVKRSGFVSSTNYSNEFRRKKDLYVFAAGSVFHHRFKGDVYDVSDGGRHPVYRYAKPLFVGLDMEVV